MQAGQIGAKREEYRPPAVGVPFVGESPPANGTFFYYGNSLLARYTQEVFEAASSEFTSVPQFVTAFRQSGCYLVDLCHDPVNGLAGPQRRKARKAGIANLSAIMRELRQTMIVVVMKAIQRYVATAAADAGLAGVPRRVLPFPAQGHQRQYVAQLAELLKEIPLVRP